MAQQNFNPDDVAAAMTVLERTRNHLTGMLKDRGFPKAEVFAGSSAFQIYPFGLLTDDTRQNQRVGYAPTIEAAVAHIEGLPAEWTPSICEQTLYAGMEA